MASIDAYSLDNSYKSKETDCNNYKQYSYSEYKGVDWKKTNVFDVEASMQAFPASMQAFPATMKANATLK